jgi:hypothetical protein
VLLLGTVPALAQTPDQPVDLTKVLPPPVTAPAAGAPVSFGGGRTLSVLDDFNRADGPIGPNWTVSDGYCNVVSNAATCGNMGRATFNSAPGDGNMAEIDLVVLSTELDYQGVLLNYGAGNSNLFLKVQNQSGGQLLFSHAACYTGNNGTGFGLGFFALSSPFATAHMKATRVGNDVTIEFTNIDGGAQPPQTYVCSGAPAPEGTGIGILGYSGLDRLDNFGGPGEVQELFINRNKIFQHPSAPTVVKVVTQWEIYDQSGMPVEGALMAGEWTLPDASIVPGVPFYGLTDVLGHEKFRLMDVQTGTYMFCVTSITKAGYFWDPGDPLKCLSINIE